MSLFSKYIYLFLFSFLIFSLNHCQKERNPEEMDVKMDVNLTPKQSPYDHTNRGMLTSDFFDLPVKIGKRSIKPNWIEANSCVSGQLCHQTGNLTSTIAYGEFGQPETNFWMVTNQNELLHFDGTNLKRIPIGLETNWRQIDVFPTTPPVAWIASLNGDVARCTLTSCELKKQAKDVGLPQTVHLRPQSILATSETTAWMQVDELDSTLTKTSTSLYHFDGTTWTKIDFSKLISSDYEIAQIGGSKETDVWALLAFHYSGQPDLNGQIMLVHFDGTTWTIDSSLPAHSLFNPQYIQKTTTDRWLVGNSDNGFHTNTDELTLYQWDDALKIWNDVTQVIKLPSNIHLLRLSQDPKGNIYLLGSQENAYQVFIWNGTKWTQTINSSGFLARNQIASSFFAADSLYILGQDLSLWIWKNNSWNLMWDPDALNDQDVSSVWDPTLLYMTPSRTAWLFFCLDSHECRLLHGSLDETEWDEYNTSVLSSIWGSQDEDMWFGTNDYGLYHYDGKQFTHYGVNPNILNTKEGYDRFNNLYCGFPEIIQSIHGTSNQDIWATTPGTGGTNSCLLHFDGNSWVVIKDSPSVDFIWPVAKDNVWALDKHYLWHFTGQVWERKDPKLSQEFSSLAVDKQGTPWLQAGTYSGTVWTFEQDAWQKKELPVNVYGSHFLTADQTGSIWMLSNWGSVFQFSQEENQWKEELPAVARPEVLRSFTVGNSGQGETWVIRATEINTRKQ